VHQHPQIASDAILPASESEQLDLQLSLVQGSLSFLPESLQLLVQPVEQGGSGHGDLLGKALFAMGYGLWAMGYGPSAAQA
jgi:hypothetical protein